MATILVEILGNAKQFKSELDGAVKSTEKAGGTFAKLGKVSAVAGAAIATGVVVGLTKSVEAAMDAEEATARLNTAFAASHVSAKKYAGAIEEAESKSRNLGFTNEDVKGSLGSLIVATHDGHKAIQDLGIAQDIARFKHVNLETATKSLTMAMAGSQRATKALGIDVPKVTSHYDTLKATMGTTIDANEKLQLAHAKLEDKMATSNQVIATVSEKLHGQAQAYADTAAGGMAVFHAQLQNIEEKIGTALLPTLNTLLKWLNAELPVAVAKTQEAIKFLTPYFLQIKTAVEQVVAAVRAHWTEISAVIKAVFEEVKAILNLFGDLIHGRWSQIWDDLVAVVKGEAKLLIAEAKLIGPLLLAALEAVAKLALKGLENGLKALPGVLKAGMQALPGLAMAAAQLVGEAIVKGLQLEFSLVRAAAVKIGEELIRGVLDGLSGLGSAIKSKIEGTLGGVLSNINIPGFSPPAHAASEAIGKPLAQGVLDGWLVGSAALPAAMSQGLQKAIEAGRAVIQAAQAEFQAAWSQITSDADSAFRGIKGAVQTPAEKALADAQAAHDKAGRDQALTSAQGALATAQAGGDPAAILAAQQQLADAQYAIQIDALQKQAEAERLQRDAEIGLQQRHFDAALVALQGHLAKGHATYAEAHAAIIKLFKSFGINYSKAGRSLGAAFVTGLKESIADAAKGSGDLSGTLDKVAGGIKVPQAATGGFVAQTGLAVIHQGETITPAGQGGGVNITINGYVSDEHLEQMRNMLIRTGRRTTGGALGGFA